MPMGIENTVLEMTPEGASRMRHFATQCNDTVPTQCHPRRGGPCAHGARLGSPDNMAHRNATPGGRVLQKSREAVGDRQECPKERGEEGITAIAEGVDQPLSFVWSDTGRRWDSKPTVPRAVHRFRDRPFQPLRPPLRVDLGL